MGFQIKGTCPVVVQKVDKGAAHNLSSDITSSSSSTNRISSCSGWTHSRLLYPEGRLVAGCGVHCTTAVLERLLSYDTAAKQETVGFSNKGTCPVVVQKVDKGAAHNLSSDITSSSSSTNRISSCSGWTHSRLLYPEGRLVAGCGVHCTTAVQVEGDNMVQASHDKVVDAIKTTLSKQGGEEPSVTLKIGLQMVEHVHRYNYESTEDSIAHIQASCMDSRYTYSLPSQVSLHYIAHCEYN